MKGLLFDKDGTLFDFQKTWGRWAGDLIDHFGLNDANKREMAAVFDYDLDARIFYPTSPLIAGADDSFLPKFNATRPDLSPQEIIKTVQEFARNAQVEVVCDLPALFETLKLNYKLGIATNDSEANARVQLERVGAISYFDYIAGCDSGYGAKPDAGMCTAFANQMGLDPKDCAMIGDTNHDFRAGKAAGMTTIGVLTGPATREELTPLADVVLDTIADLPAWLRERGA